MLEVNSGEDLNYHNFSNSDETLKKTLDSLDLTLGQKNIKPEPEEQVLTLESIEQLINSSTTKA